jgi:hypothetical protein
MAEVKVIKIIFGPKMYKVAKSRKQWRISAGRFRLNEEE